MPTDADIAHAREQVRSALQEKGISGEAARQIADAAARNAERRRDGLPTTPRSIPTHLLRQRS